MNDFKTFEFLECSTSMLSRVNDVAKRLNDLSLRVDGVSNYHGIVTLRAVGVDGRSYLSIDIDEEDVIVGFCDGVIACIIDDGNLDESLNRAKILMQR